VENIGEPQIERRWPVFAPAVASIGVRASFSLPLIVGEMRLGAMDLYRDQVGPLQAQQLEEAQDFASAAVNVLLRRQRTSTADPASVGSGPSSSSVYQATGMVMVQLDTDAEGAFAALRARAFQEGRSLSELARAVIERRVRLADREV
jgi:hypothetical protein